MDSLAKSTKGLTNEQAVNLIMRTSLSNEEKKDLLIKAGLTAEEAAATVATDAHTAATGRATLATTLSTAATAALSAALGVLKGIMDAIAAHPIVAAIAAIIAVLSILITQTQKAKQAAEQAAEEQYQLTKRAADEAARLGDEITNLTDEYLELSKEVKINNNRKTDLIKTENELLKLLGVEQKELDGLIEKYGSVDDAIKAASVSALRDSLTDLQSHMSSAKNKVIKSAETEWVDVSSDSRYPINLNSIYYYTKDKDAFDEGTANKEAIDVLSSHPDFYAATGNNGGGGEGAFIFKIEGTDMFGKDLNSIDSIRYSHGKLKEALELVAREVGTDNVVYERLNKEYAEVNEKLKEYNSAIGKINETAAQLHIYENLIGRDMPTTTTEFEAFRDELIKDATASKDFVGTQEEIESAINNTLRAQSDFAKFYDSGGGLAAYKISFSELIADDDFSDIVDDYIERVTTLKSALESYRDGDFTNEDFVDLARKFPELADDADNLDGAIQSLIVHYNSLAKDKIGSYMEDMDTTTDQEQLAEFLEQLLGIGNIAKDSGGGIEELTEKIEELKKEVDDTISVLQSFYDVLKDVQGGKEYGTFEMFELLNTYPQLANCLVETANGYKLEEDALVDLMKEKAKATKITNAFAKANARSALVQKDSSKAEMVDALFDEYDIKSWEDFVSAYETENRVSLIPGYNWDETLKTYVEALTDEKVQNEMLDYILEELENGSIKTGESEQYKKFQEIQSDYEKQIDKIAHLKNVYNNYLDELEANGEMGSAKYYEMLKDAEEQNIDLLESELSELQTAFETAVENGEIERGSEEWHEMNSAINEVKESIHEAEIAIIEYGNSIRELDWEYFDYQQDKIEKITEEADFLIDLLSNSELHDDKGKLTNAGLSVMGLHSSNYEVYLQRAAQYAQEIADIETEIANDPYNQDLIERREELLELQRDMISAAEDEKQAIIDLVKDGIELQLDALKELIDKYSNALDEAKSLYEYQKKIKDATSQISVLQKQLIAYENDESEETRAKIQQIKVELESTQENLRENEYNQFIADQKKLFDQMYDDYSTILNNNVEDISKTITEAFATVNDNSQIIKETLEDVVDENGLKLSVSPSTFWNDESFTTSVSDVLADIAEDVLAMRTHADNQAEEDTSDIIIENVPEEEPEPETPPTNNEGGSSGGVSVQIGGGMNITPNGGSIESQIQNNTKAKQYYDRLDKLFAEQYQLNNGKYITNDILSRRLKFKSTTDISTLEKELQWFIDYFESKNKVVVPSTPSVPTPVTPSTTPNPPTPVSPGSSVVIGGGTPGGNVIINPGSGNTIRPQTVTPSSGSTLTIGGGSTVTIKRHKKGGLVNYTGLSFLDGSETKPELVLDAEDTQNFLSLRDVLAQLANDDISVGNPLYSSFAPISYTNSVPNLADKMASILHNESANTTQDIHIENHIEIDHVEDYDDFVTKLQSDKKFEKMVVSMTLGRAAGGGSLTKYKSKWK